MLAPMMMTYISSINLLKKQKHDSKKTRESKKRKSQTQCSDLDASFFSAHFPEAFQV